MGLGGYITLSAFVAAIGSQLQGCHAECVLSVPLQAVHEVAKVRHRVAMSRGPEQNSRDTSHLREVRAIVFLVPWDGH